MTIPFKGKVLAYDRSGRRLQSIDLPVDLPTCCEFGGKDLDVLYVTDQVGSVGLTPNTGAGAKAYRCVTDPLN